MYPADPMADVYVPNPDKEILAEFKLATSVQEVPFHCSVSFFTLVPGDVLPPKAKAAVYNFPAPA